jgi:capsular exopolysaccharide synthesis family protein
MDSQPTARPSILREAHLRDYWKIAWQGRWMILATFVVVVGATAVWTFLQRPVYRATAIVEVQPQTRRLFGAGDMSGLGAAGYGWFAEEKYHNTQMEIIKSRDVARRVVQLLGLQSHPMFEKAPDAVDAFRSMLVVESRRDTGLLEISLLGEDPRQITQWVNATAKAYVERNFDQARARVEQATQTIRTEMDKLSGELGRAEEARIRSLKDDAEGHFLNSEAQAQIVNEDLKTYSGQRTRVNIELSQLGGVLEQIRRLRDAGRSPVSVSELARDAVLQEREGERARLEREVESARITLRLDHPKYREKLAELRSAEAKVEQRVDELVKGLETQYAQALENLRFLEIQIREADAYSVEMAKATSRHELTKTDTDVRKQTIEVIARTLQDVNLNAQLMTNNVSLLDEATPPLFPVRPHRRLNLAIGAMFGLFLGLAAVFFLDYLDNTIRTPEDVEKYLGLAVVGVIPKMAEAGMGQRAVKEAYQSLRTSIIFSSKNRQRKVALITSTGPREGKSSTVANLARTLAAGGDRVVVIDCDLRRPTQHVHFEKSREPGLTNYLAAEAEDHDWARCITALTPANLGLLPCGPLPPSPPELLSNARFREMLEEMRGRYEWILIDSPPAASLADASLLATLADMVVLVVQHNATDRDHVIKTVQQLRSVNAAFAGVVINNVDLERAYHKDYYYSDYYQEDGKPRGRTRRPGGAVEAKSQAG